MALALDLDTLYPNRTYWESSLKYPYIYAMLILTAEVCTGLFYSWGLMMHMFILIAILLHSAFISDKKISYLLTAMSISPLIRVLSLATPVEDFSHITWFMIISTPVFIATFTIAHIQNTFPRDMFLARPKLEELPLILAICLLAVPIGFTEYFILRPDPIAEFTIESMLAPALIFIVATGFLEELIFRGLLQRYAEDLAGYAGIVFISILFGFLHATNLTGFDVILAGFAGFMFALVVKKTGNIWGVSLSHGIVNICLFLIAPHVVG